MDSAVETIASTRRQHARSACTDFAFRAPRSLTIRGVVTPSSAIVPQLVRVCSFLSKSQITRSSQMTTPLLLTRDEGRGVTRILSLVEIAELEQGVLARQAATS